MILRFVVIACLGISAALAAETPDFSGKWQFDASKSKGQSDDAVLMIDQKSGSIHVQALSQSNQTLLDYTCGTGGKECDIQDGGKPAKISLWYMGPTLVVLETGRNGEEVVKRKMAMSKDGALEIEYQRIVPAGDTDTLYFTKK
jgi:hypothetical protein